MAMLVKGQVRAVPRGDMPAQRSFVQQIFGITACAGRSRPAARAPSANATDPFQAPLSVATAKLRPHTEPLHARCVRYDRLKSQTADRDERAVDLLTAGLHTL